MFNKKAAARSISLGMTTVVLVGAGLLSGCTTMTDGIKGNPKPADENPPAVEESNKDKIMAEFTGLVGENPKPDKLLEFIDKNISGVSAKDASTMLVELEKAQKNYLPVLEQKYYDDTAIQKGLFDIYKQGFDLSKTYDTKVPELKALLDETKAMGYKLETAEGMFFPIMDYEYLKKYSPYAQEDIKAYIDIMAVESGKVPAKDGALVISWDEVVERATAQESFIKKYGSSVKLGDMKELHKKYLIFMLYGLNNTPLFSYDTKLMDPEAKAAYERAVKAGGDSEMLQQLGKYMDILEKTDYKLSEEAEQFRKAATGNN